MFSGLEDSSSSQFSLCHYLLTRLHEVRAFSILPELKDCDDLSVSLLSKVLDIAGYVSVCTFDIQAPILSLKLRPNWLASCPFCWKSLMRFPISYSKFCLPRYVNQEGSHVFASILIVVARKCWTVSHCPRDYFGLYDEATAVHSKLRFAPQIRQGAGK
jgi:hypothetical protein